MTLHLSILTLAGYLAAFCTTLSFVPQLVRVWRLHSARDISLLMFLVFPFGVFLWLIYGISIHSIPGAESPFDFASCAARLKSCPDTKPKTICARTLEPEHETLLHTSSKEWTKYGAPGTA